MKRFICFAFALALIGAVGCAKSPKATETAPKAPPQKKEAVSKAAPAAEATGGVAVKEEAVEQKPSAAVGMEEQKVCELKEFPNIHFAFDRYDLNDEAKRILTQIADYMKQCPDLILTIEGHCDERGSNEYNLALGWKRANEAKRFLVALGVDPNRIITVSYGEERPLCFEHNEACWAKNRRDHFVFCRGECLR